MLSGKIAQNRVSSTYVPAIFLSVAAFLLHIVLSRLVSLQRPEIALLKAFGYSNATVGAHYLKLALCIVSGGVAVGVGLGVWLGHKIIGLYTEFYHFPQLLYYVDGKIVLLAIIISG